MTDVELGEARQAARPLRIIARFLRRSWQAIVVISVVIALGIAAYLSPGLVQADVHLDEGTVYVGKRDSNLMGTVNAQIDELSAATGVGDSQFTLIQHEEQVQAFLPQSWNLHPYSPARNILDRATKVPTNGAVQQVDGRMLVYDQENGRVWHGTTDEMLEVDFHRDKADLEVGEFGVATLTTSGKVIGLNPNDATLVRMEGETVVTTPVPMEFNPEARDFEISAVGDTAVVLNRGTAQVWAEGLPKAFTISGRTQAMLLPPVDAILGGEGRARAVLVTRAGLQAISSDGIRSLSGMVDLLPVRPVQVGDCLYGAFANGPGEGRLVKRCAGEEAVVTELEHLTSDGSQLAFQVNRTTVALNDLSNGTVWLVNRGTVILPADWENVRPVIESDDTEITEGDPTVVPDRSLENRPPVAVDDELGARAGQSTILSILDNDTDPDGDILTITVNQTDLEHATLQLVRGGAGLQITVNPGVEPGTVIEVPYTIHDGNDESDSATAFVEVFPEDATLNNQAPHPRGQGADVGTVPPPQPLRVRKGDVDVTFRALLDWRDPEGDPLLLRRAYLDAQWDDIVRFTPDGEITYTDVGKTAGDKVIHIVVEDAHGAQKEGEIVVSVSEEALPPTVYGDFVTTLQGEMVTVEPLANDIRATNLTEVASTDCAECIVPHLADNRFTFASDQAGTYYVDYSVNNGGFGLVRIDVLPKLTNRAPVAVLDVAHMPAMGSVTIDPLLNDTDPDGDVLVIQTIENVRDDLRITMERRTLLTIEATRELTERRLIKYRVSDGLLTGEGTILVVPTPASDEIGPRVEDDVLRVRAGATGSVNVLDNDTAPDGRGLTLHEELVENPFGDNAWVDGERVRVSVPAGTAPGLMQVRYRVSDRSGEARDGLVRVTVVSEEASNADPPQPRQVIDRMLAGTSTRIPIPLDGIDPQGDSVRLLGIGSIPRLGRILDVGERYFEYEAFMDSTGTDTFRYVVVDTHGQQATGEIRVGIAAPSQINSRPIAVLDTLTTRPGRTVQYAPLTNDYDLDGDPISFANREPARMQDDIGVDLVDETELVMVAPQEQGDYHGTYDIIDQRGETATGALLLTVDEGAALLPPVTRDDLVDATQLGSSPFVVVEPLLNDYDPDGPRGELRVSLPEPDADDELAPRLTGEGEVTIGVRDTMQQVRYTAVDGDGLETSGLIAVPGRGDVVPTLRNPGQEMSVRAGEELTITINDVVQGTNGREVRLPNTIDIEGFRGQTKAVGDGTVSYTPDRSFWGKSVVVFKVQDVMQAADEAQAPEAFISVPVNVHRAEARAGVDPEDPDDLLYMVNERPEQVVDNMVLQVGAGEGPRSLDVSRYFIDPEGTSVSLLGRPTEGAGDAPIVWDVRGNSIVVEATEQARKGQTKQLHGEVVDASVDANRTPFTMTVEVVASSFPQVTITREITEVLHAGESVNVAVTDAAVAHLPHDASVYLEGARRVSGNGRVQALPGSGIVQITADPGWNGQLVVGYTVNDALHDPDRQVEGRITVTVVDIPPAPAAPYVLSVGDGTATVRYSSSGTSGEGMVTTEGWAYIGAARSKQGTCAGGVCTFTGLQNGQRYTARVIDTNEVGPSGESPESAAFVPDVKLLPPQTPTVTFDDGALDVAWTHNPMWDSSSNTDSRVAAYVVSRWKGSTRVDQRQVDGGALGLKWDGIPNGEAYSFSVQALSSHASDRAEDFHSVDSGISAPEHPTGPPNGATTVTPTSTRSGIGGGFRVAFTTAGINGNGDTVSQYRVVPVTSAGELTDKQAIVTPGGDEPLSAEVYGLGNAAAKFRVYAQNRYTAAHGGDALVGESPEWLTAWARPTISSLEVTRGDGQIGIFVEHSMPADSPGVLRYSLGDSWVDMPLSGEAVATGLTNGRAYPVTVKAVLDSMESAPVSEQAMPRSDRPLPPSISSVALNGRDLDHVTVRLGELTLVDTGGWSPDAYLFCGSGGTNCQGQYRNVREVEVPVSGGNVLWTVEGGGSGALPVDPTISRPPALSGTNTVSFAFSRVDHGNCTIHNSLNRGDVEHENGPFEALNGRLEYSGAQWIPQDPIWVTPPPTEEDPNPEPTPQPQPDAEPRRIRVVCQINGSTSTYNLK